MHNLVPLSYVINARKQCLNKIFLLRMSDHSLVQYIHLNLSDTVFSLSITVLYS